MPPTIHLVRHAQGYHDTEPQALNKLIRDPKLTPYGEQQCRAFRDAYSHHESLQLICASPLRRTLQTAHICFEPAIGRGAPAKVLALPDAQEVTDLPSDCGHPTEWLEEHLGECVDFSVCRESPYWYRKLGRYAFEQDALSARAKRLRRWLRARPEKHIALVSHGMFLHYITGNIDQKGEQTGDYWLNTQIREMYFISENDGDAKLEETSGSIEARKQGSAELQA